MRTLLRKETQFSSSSYQHLNLLRSCVQATTASHCTNTIKTKPCFAASQMLPHFYHQHKKPQYKTTKTMTTSNLKTLSAVLLIVCAINFNCYVIECEITKQAANVCNRTELEHITTREIVPTEHTTTDTSNCGLLSLSCRNTKKIVISTTRIVTKVQNTTKYFCCDGYEELGGSCLPKCSSRCSLPRKCIKPDVCECAKPPFGDVPGQIGETCDQLVCLPNPQTNGKRWGEHCDEKCSCSDPEDLCYALNGTCFTPINNYDFPKPEPRMPMITEPRSSNEVSYAFANYVMIAAILTLLATLVHYRQRLHKAKNDLFQVAYSARTDSSFPQSCNDAASRCRRSSSSVYAMSSTSSMSNYNSAGTYNYSSASTIGSSYRGVFGVAQRSLPSVPESESGVGETDNVAREKSFANLNYFSANPSTSKQANGTNNTPKVKPIVNAKVEARLMTSQRAPELNIYSDMGSSVYKQSSEASNYCEHYLPDEEASIFDSACARIEPISRLQPAVNNQTDNRPSTSTAHQGDSESHYQVPKSSPSFSSRLSCVSEDSANIYEEIKLAPQTTPRESLNPFLEPFEQTSSNSNLPKDYQASTSSDNKQQPNS